MGVERGDGDGNGREAYGGGRGSDFRIEDWREARAEVSWARLLAGLVEGFEVSGGEGFHCDGGLEGEELVLGYGGLLICVCCRRGEVIGEVWDWRWELERLGAAYVLQAINVNA